MNDDIIVRNSLKAWFLAARPKTLSGAAVPVMIGLALAFKEITENQFNWIPALLCLLFAFVMQIDANFINDLFDFKKGNDNETRLGPARACAQGWIAPSSMLKAIVLTTLTACIIGFPLIFYGGIRLILIGLLCVIFCFLYTTCLSYHGLGDLLVLVFFGLIPVCIPYYILTHTISLLVVIASIACGLVIDTLLIVNNYRDYDNDKQAGKNTLIVKIGLKKGGLFYFLSGATAVTLGAIYVIYDYTLAFFLPLIYLILHYHTYQIMICIHKGKALNMVLGKTAFNMLAYGVLTTLGIILSSLLPL